MTDSHTLLASYVRTGLESAFRELVSRYLDLVYSTAFRLVGGDAQSAQDVAQSVFVALAAKAGTLPKDVMLGGWLHEHTRFVAGKLMRSERRRQSRERQVAEMNAIEDHSESNLAQVAPVLDEAIGQLDAEDRTAILLRFFERQDFRSVGEALGSSEEAARKRVDRALEKLHVLLKHRGATLSAAALGTTLATEAVRAAPAGLAATISSAAVLAGTTLTSTVTATKAIVMTTLQKSLIVGTVAVAVAVGTGIFELRQNSKLRGKVQTLQQQQTPLADQLQQLRRERDDATNRLAALTDELARVKENPSEVLKLRGEVGALRQEKAATDSQSAVSKAVANPETRKVLRERQKVAMSGLYTDLAKRLKLTPEQTGQFNDLLADRSMDGLDLVMQALHDGKSQAEVRQVFSGLETAFQGKVQALLGDDALTQYKDYTKNLGSTLFIDSFGASLTGDPATVADKKSRLL